MEDKINPDPKKPSLIKYAGLSGHESNVIPFMLQYGLTSEECIIDNLKKKIPGPTEGCETSPKFAANFMWELSQDLDSKKWYVGTFYNNKLINACKTPNADKYCAYEDFKAFLNEKFILSKEKFDEVCVGVTPVPSTGESSGSGGESSGTSAGSTSTEEQNNLWLYIAIGLIVLVVIQLVVIIFVVSKLKAKVRQNIEDDSHIQPSLDIQAKYKSQEA